MSNAVKKIIFSMALIFCGLEVVSAEWKDFADNGGGKDKPPFDYCPECKYVTPRWGSGTTTIVITDKDGNQIAKTICSKDVREEGVTSFIRMCKNPSDTNCCDIVSDEVPTPLNPDGSTNEEYHKFWNEWFDDAIVDGELNKDSDAAKMMAEMFCDDFNGKISSDCQNQIKDMVAESKDDDMDFIAYPGQVICTDQNAWSDCQIMNNYTADMCSKKFPGVNELLCKYVAEACFAGSETDYQEENGYTEVKKGDSGFCTYDSFNDYDFDSCPQQCYQKCNGNDNECYSECIQTECYSCENTCESLCSLLKSDGAKYKECYDKCLEEFQCKSPDDTPISPIPPEEPDPSECPSVTCEEKYSYTECNPTITKPLDIEETGGTCGENYSYTKYDWSTEYVDSCETTHYLVKTMVSVEVPGQLNKPVYAGQGFNWGGFNAKVTVIKKVESSLQLEADKKKIEVEILNLNNSYECQAKQLKENYITDMKNCGTEYGNCMKETSGDSAKCDPISVECGESAQKKYADAIAKIEEEKNTNSKYKELEKKLEELEKCAKEVANATPIIETYTDFPTSRAQMILENGFEQFAGDIKSVLKNSGLSSKDFLIDNAFSIDYDFFIPSTAGGTKGILTQSISSDFFNIEVSCPLETIISELIVPSGINVIYRPISLSNPFPNSNLTESDSRKTVGYWYQGVANMIILNNREVKGNEVYNLQPMYTITLTPSDIKDIRKYNNTTDYTDFRMKCEGGLYCRSNFLWGFDSSYANFNHLIDYSNSCAMGNEWYSCDSDYYAGARDELLKKLK